MQLVRMIYKRENASEIKSVIVKESQVHAINACSNIKIMTILPIKKTKNVKRDYILK